MRIHPFCLTGRRAFLTAYSLYGADLDERHGVVAAVVEAEFMPGHRYAVDWRDPAKKNPTFFWFALAVMYCPLLENEPP